MRSHDQGEGYCKDYAILRIETAVARKRGLDTAFADLKYSGGNH